QKPDGGTDVELNHPFGAGRNGFVLSEGSYIVVLEELESAKKRDATIYAEVAGQSSLYIGSRNFTKEQKIDKASRAMQSALKESNLDANGVGLVCASANSSEGTDDIEAMSLQKAGIRFPVMAPKSIAGESYGASGAMQVAVSALA